MNHTKHGKCQNRSRHSQGVSSRGSVRDDDSPIREGLPTVHGSAEARKKWLFSVALCQQRYKSNTWAICRKTRGITLVAARVTRHLGYHISFIIHIRMPGQRTRSALTLNSRHSIRRQDTVNTKANHGPPSLRRHIKGLDKVSVTRIRQGSYQTHQLIRNTMRHGTQGLSCTDRRAVNRHALINYGHLSPTLNLSGIRAYKGSHSTVPIRHTHFRTHKPLRKLRHIRAIRTHTTRNPQDCIGTLYRNRTTNTL